MRYKEEPSSSRQRESLFFQPREHVLQRNASVARVHIRRCAYHASAPIFPRRRAPADTAPRHVIGIRRFTVCNTPRVPAVTILLAQRRRRDDIRLFFHTIVAWRFFVRYFIRAAEPSLRHLRFACRRHVIAGAIGAKRPFPRRVGERICRRARCPVATILSLQRFARFVARRAIVMPEFEAAEHIHALSPEDAGAAILSGSHERGAALTCSYESTTSFICPSPRHAISMPLIYRVYSLRQFATPQMRYY